MAAIKKGDTVRQILPAPIVGVVQKFDVCQEHGTLQVLVEWPDTDGDGMPQSRYFHVDDVEVVAP